MTLATQSHPPLKRYLASTLVQRLAHILREKQSRWKSKKAFRDVPEHIFRDVGLIQSDIDALDRLPSLEESSTATLALMRERATNW